MLNTDIVIETQGTVLTFLGGMVEELWEVAVDALGAIEEPAHTGCIDGVDCVD